MIVIYHFRSELLFNDQLFLSFNLAVVVAAGKSKENGTLKPSVVPRSTSGMSRENDMPTSTEIQECPVLKTGTYYPYNSSVKNTNKSTNIIETNIQ